METEKYKAKATAAGKIIVSGEHAAVYGRPALAMATSCKATTHISSGKRDGVLFDIPNLDYRLDFSEERLRSLYEKLQTRYDDFLEGRCSIHDVLDHPIELIPFAFAGVWKHTGWQPLDKLRVGLAISIPVGCGMGSSAAVGISTIKAAIRLFDLSFSKDDIFEQSMTCERLMHGHPSGVDSSVSLYGGAFRFEGGELSSRSIPKWNLTLLNSGRPSVSTGECVESVRSRFRKDDPIWDDFEAVTNAIDRKLSSPVDAELIELIQQNHNLLCDIGVVPVRIQNVISEVEAMGGAAKICGAGAVDGENAGVIMIVGDCDIDYFIEHSNLKLVEHC